jgi:FMN phosphatase YigB (HAD superfamily)
VTKLRLAFDLDETLGVPILDTSTMIGWQTRPGCLDLLERLQQRFILVLWSVAPRRYVERALSFGLGAFFAEVYSWEEQPGAWKDVRKIDAAWLIDDSPHNRVAAQREGIEERYVVVPVYGSPEDSADPLAWVRQVEAALA